MTTNAKTLIYNDTALARFYRKIRKTDTCWWWMASGGSTNGYGQFWSGSKRVDAHRASYNLHKGEIPRGMVVMHGCDNRMCVNPEHLSLGSQTDNLRDMYKKGRGRSQITYAQQAGDKAWNASFTNQQAEFIRKEYARGDISWGQLAKKYAVDKKTIGNILKGRTYVY